MVASMAKINAKTLLGRGKIHLQRAVHCHGSSRCNFQIDFTRRCYTEYGGKQVDQKHRAKFKLVDWVDSCLKLDQIDWIGEIVVELLDLCNKNCQKLLWQMAGCFNCTGIFPLFFENGQKCIQLLLNNELMLFLEIFRIFFSTKMSVF